MTERFPSPTRHKLIVGDIHDVCSQLDRRSFDAVLCDPPYDLTSGKKGGSGEASTNLGTPHGRARITTGGGFMGKEWDATGVAFNPETWKIISKLLRPGAHVLAAGGTRTFHRMVCAIEDSGLEIRDTICWLYASGFPKSSNVSKAIDRTAGAERKVVGSRKLGGNAAMTTQEKGGTYASNTDSRGVVPIDVPITEAATRSAKEFEGYGTALKPAWEGWTLARKPMKSSASQNARVSGVGALSIDACRIEATEEGGRPHRVVDPKPEANGDVYAGRRNAGTGFDGGSKAIGHTTQGRWPANLVLDEEASEMLDFHKEGASRFFYCAKVSKSERNAGLEDMPELPPLDGRTPDSDGTKSPRAGANRNGGSQNPHPTLKPIALTTYLAKLLLPPSRSRPIDMPRRILVPFAGAGSEMIGALLAGWDEVVGIELFPEYASIAEKRIAHYFRFAPPAAKPDLFYEALKGLTSSGESEGK